MFLNKSTTIIIILLCSCTSNEQNSSNTWLYGYGRVEKINGRVKKLIEKRWSSKMDPYYAYTFDNKGNVVRIEDVFQSGTDTTKYSTVYNNDKKIESIGLGKDVGKDFKEIYKYDNNGSLTRCIGNAYNSSPDTDRFIYDGTGNLIEQQQYFEKKPLWIFKFKYFYNNKGVCTGVEQTMTTWRDNFKKLRKDTTRYIVFDSKNNWLKAVDFLNDTITRKITYY